MKLSLKKLGKAIFGPSRVAKPTASARTIIEQERASAVEPDYSVMSEDMRKAVNFTPEEKQRFLALRDQLQWLPSTGPNGSWLTWVSSDVKAQGLKGTKQYVHSALYPEDPRRLFQTRTPSYRAVWVALETCMMSKFKADPSLVAYVSLMENLAHGRSVWVRNMKSPRLVLIERKCRDSGLVVKVVVQKSKIPHDYFFTPAIFGDKIQPKAGRLDIESTSEDIRALLKDIPSVELFGVNRTSADVTFPERVITRVGNKHYRADKAAA